MYRPTISAACSSVSATPPNGTQQLGAAQEGVVVSRFGMHADVEDSADRIYCCNLRHTLKSLLTGNRVV